MKKRSITAIGIICALLMTACGSANETTPAETPTETPAETAEQPAATEEAPAADAPAADAAEEGSGGLAEFAADTLNGMNEDGTEGSGEKEAVPENGVVSNGLFSIRIPDKFDGLYVATTTDTSISICEKASRDAGYGGFAFGLIAYDDPDAYAGIPGGSKIGELKSGSGVLYDIVLDYPTDVQFDYNNSDGSSYMELYEAGESVAAGLESADGGKYTAGAGTKGEELYADTLKEIVQAIQEEAKKEDLSEDDGSMSFEYALEAHRDPENVLDHFGYAYVDVNVDGIEELVICPLYDGMEEYPVYDIYTMVNRKPAHVVSGSARDCWFVPETGFLCNRGSGGAGLTMWYYYDLAPNSTELWPQLAFKYDSDTDKDNPWFWCYDIDFKEWEKAPEAEWTERMSGLEKFRTFDLKPLSSVVK